MTQDLEPNDPDRDGDRRCDPLESQLMEQSWSESKGSGVAGVIVFLLLCLVLFVAVTKLFGRTVSSKFCPCGCDHSVEMVASIDMLDNDPALLEIERILAIQAEREHLVGYITEAMVTHRLRLMDLATQKLGQAPPLPKPSSRALVLRQSRMNLPPVADDRIQVRTEMIAYGDYREEIRGKEKHYPASFRLWVEATNLTSDALTLAPPTLASQVPLPVSRWFVEDTVGQPFDGRLKAGETKSLLVIGDMGEPIKAGAEFDVNVRFDELDIPIRVRTRDSSGSV